MRVYLDNNASTPLDPRVREAMIHAMDLCGNASSIHAEGREARSLIDEARVTIGRLLDCDHRQILFTSGGTESNNLAILGFARANRHKGNHLVTSEIEHSAVLSACKQLQLEGFDITYVAPDRNGVIHAESVSKALRPDTILVSIMLANNEVGTLQPIPEIAALAHDLRIAIHTDAVQALGKIPLHVRDLGVDLLSISAHKIYGPKGIGALYYSPEIEIQPLLRGGTHEKGLRAGTENVAAIHGFGTAASILLQEGLPELLPLRQKLEEALAADSMTIICRDAARLPNTVNFYSQTWLGESMVMAFDLEGIAVSNGSACSSGVIEPSHVILALGYNEQVARSVIRVSLGKFTSVSDVDYFARVVHDLSLRGET